MAESSYLVLQIALSILYLLSSWTKATNIQRFASGVMKYGILSARFSVLWAWIVMVLELVLGAAHCTGYFMSVAAPMGVLLLSIFLVAISLNYNKDIACHCFGDSETISSRSVLRLVLIVGGEVALCAHLFLKNPPLTLIGHRLSMTEVFYALPFASALLISLVWLFSVPELIFLFRDLRWLENRKVAWF
jgi:uncharacterized membrane protein YphA (DoxX/SURF4 family)